MAVVRKFRALVVEVDIHTPEVITYCLQPEKPLPRFRAGQFLHLALDEFDGSGEWPDSRTFSMASSPDCRDRVRITISRVGAFTGRMVDELVIGSSVWLKLPYGEFTFSDPSPVYVLIAGGTGLAPFASYLEHCLETGERERRITLYYGVRSAAHLLYPELIARCCARLPGFSVTYYSEDGGITAARKGRMNISEIFAQHCTSEVCWYLSGPFPMVEAFGTELHQLGVALDRIQRDDW
jgi:ferredoxin-NADP reductase